MINLQELKNKLIHAKAHDLEHYQVPIKTLEVMIDMIEAFKLQHEGLAEVIKSAEESRDAAVQIQRELISVLPELEGAYRKQNHALAYLRTLAGFGGTLEQARTLAEKAVKELG